ncbi:MAG: S-layer homology domain-containing protein [Clostridiaceae bacterium]|nr:S-layer homology domain-containing protein [Clostridiaceae bacterium]
MNLEIKKQSKKIALCLSVIMILSLFTPIFAWANDGVNGIGILEAETVRTAVYEEKTLESKKEIGRSINILRNFEEVDKAKTKQQSNSLVKKQLDRNLEYLYETIDNPTFGTGAGEWSILCLARGGYQVDEGYYALYYENVEEEVKRLMEINPVEKLDRNKGTEHSRLILGLTSIGKDITNVAGYDIREALADFNYVTRQGINGPIFALIAFDTHQYDIPIDKSVEEQTTREKCIAFILDREIDGGGWALTGNVPDPDITAMAIQGLTPYYESKPQVKASVDRAITWLSENQREDGGYSSWGSINSESCAQVIVALTGLGIDPHRDERFIKNGISAVDNLMSFTVSEGGFMHVKPGGNTGGGAEAGVVDGMATDQGTYALVAYDRFVNGKNSLYDMTDVVINKEELPKEEEELPEEGVLQVEVPNDGKDYKIAIEDKKEEIKIIIPSQKYSKVLVDLPLKKELPRIEAIKGKTTAVFPKGVQVIRGNATAVEIITSKNTGDRILRNRIANILPKDEELEAIEKVISMGGDKRIEFDDFITLTFEGMRGREAAYVQDGRLYTIKKFRNDTRGENSRAAEYSYDNGKDLIIKTKHFTDFVVYATKEVEEEIIEEEIIDKNHITLSIDKLTINKGYVLRPTKVEFKDGENVWDVLKREMDSRGISYEYEWTPKYGSVYVQSIDGDGEFDHGSGSGWMYNVDGWYPNYGASRYTLEDGERVEWRYTTDLGADLGEDITKWEEELEEEELEEELEEEELEEEELEEETMLWSQEDGEINLEKVYKDADNISSWAYEAIKKATVKGFVGGSGGLFNPKASITRAEFTKMIVAMLELEVYEEDVIKFVDVNKQDWFYLYVNTIYKEGVIKGYGNQFKPNDYITREEMAVILTRALDLKPSRSKVTPKDMQKASSWAETAIETTLSLGLMGESGENFNPQALATREMATVVMMRGYTYRQEKLLECDKEKKVDKINEVKEVKHRDVSRQIERSAAFLQKNIPEPIVASVGGEWTVFGLARSGEIVPKEYYEKYYQNVENTLKEKAGILHRVKYTEYDRVILALTAIGKDITDVGGYDLRKPLADFNTLIIQGINGPIFALIALDSNNYEIPIDEEVEVQTTREKLIEFILNREISGGGWALGQNPPEADPDITAMAIQSLAPYYEKNEKVKEAVDRGVEWLSQVQQSNGGYHSWGADNAESIAQVVVALTALGIDPHNDPRFIKNGKSTIDALLTFEAVGGGFYHVKAGGQDSGGAKPGEVDFMATDQAMYALVAYDRFVQGKNALYDMKDVE